MLLSFFRATMLIRLLHFEATVLVKGVYLSVITFILEECFKMKQPSDCLILQQHDGGKIAGRLASEGKVPPALSIQFACTRIRNDLIVCLQIQRRRRQFLSRFFGGLLIQFFDGSEVQGFGGAGGHAGRLPSLLHTIHAQMAFLHPAVMAELGNAEGASQLT
jgi:hypothetical protein